MLTAILSFDQLDESYLRSVCEGHWPETDTLEFKRDLPGNSDKDKHELQKDVAAFANLEGGDIVYGIEESEGAASALSPLSGEPADSAVRRVLQVLDGIEPRVQGLRAQTTPVANGYVLVVRVPRSFDGPHSFRVNNARRFVVRLGTATSNMSVEQLRAAFGQTMTLRQRAQQLIDSRLNLVKARKTSKPLINGPVGVVHGFSMAGVAGQERVDLGALYAGKFSEFMFESWRGADRNWNLDGLVVHPGPWANDPRVLAATQVFRNGGIEALQYAGSSHEDKLIPSTVITTFFRAAISKFLGASKTWGYSGAAVVSCALLDVEGCELGVGGDDFGDRRGAADRSDLILAPSWVERLESANIDDVTRPLMDTLWQGFDIERCLEYDEAGLWAPRR